MKTLKRLAILAAVLLLFSALGSSEARAQSTRNKSGYLEYFIEGGDTIYVDQIRAAKVFAKMPRQKGKDWRKYYKLVYNFSKAYPYALIATAILEDVDSTLLADNLQKAKREKYLKSKQDELFKVFEKPMRNMTVSQGALLMKLIDRQAGKSSFNIIKEYRNNMAAGFWQGIAKMFGSDLKRHYDPEGEDANTEELVQFWEAGDFPAFYFSLFWEYPKELPIPEEYLRKANLQSSLSASQSATR